MKSIAQNTIAGYADGLPTSHAAIGRVLQKAIDAALPNSAARMWHRMPVWFIDENPIVGYKASAGRVTLLFWSGQSFGDPALKPVGRFQAAQIQFTDAAQIDLKVLGRWLKESRTKIWDYRGHFKKQKAWVKQSRSNR